MSEKKEINPIEDVLNALGETSGAGFEEIALLLALPDEQFNIMSEAVLSELERSLMSTNERLMLVTAIQSQGVSAEQLSIIYQETIRQIDEKIGNQLSQEKKDFLKRLLAMVSNAISETEGSASKIINIPIELCREGAKIPEYATAGDAGMDVYATEDYEINPGQTIIIPLGIKTALPLGYELQVRPRSGQSIKTKLRIANSPGTIDAHYRDEIGVIVENIEPNIKDIEYESDFINDVPVLKILSIEHGQTWTISKGQKFAQLVLSQKPAATFTQVKSVQEIGENRGGGFGHTGD